MDINLKNYESYFMDYLDGSLTPPQIHELQAFLLINSELSELLEDWQHVKLKAPNLKYPYHSLLKKDELHACTDYFTIAYTENTLTKADRITIDRHPELLNNLPIYQKLKLQADTKITYKKKSLLYHKKRLSAIIMRFSVAASLLLLIGITFLYYSHHTPITSRTSQMFLPLSSPVFISDLQPITHPSQNTIEIVKQSPKIPHSIKKNKEEKIIEVFKTDPLITELPIPKLEFNLSNSNSIPFIKQPEIYLAESAIDWKPSERKILSDNILLSIINTGKIIAEKRKNKSNVE